MKAYFLFLFLITSSYCLHMSQVSIASEKSLSTYTPDLNYFYLTKSEYSSFPSYIYFILKDNGFSLSYSNLQYCQTNTNPGSSPDIAVSNCNFNSLSSYGAQTFLSPKKYYYNIPKNNYYNYSIISYYGNYSNGSLYVSSGNFDLLPNILTNSVNRLSRHSLATSSSYDKFFCLTNSQYSSYSYIYILLEDNGFSLSYSNLKYCFTNTSPYTTSVPSDCYFNSVTYYNSQTSSSTKKYYYKIPTNSSYSYTFIYYSGRYSSGSLYVTSDYNDLYRTINMTRVYRHSRQSLPTSYSYYKYFYLANSEYSSYSYIYILLEDNGFNIYSNIEYCYTDFNPNLYPDLAVRLCSFHSVTYYNSETSSSTKKYYYKISTYNSYIYTLISYSGSYSTGSLYVTNDFYDLSILVKMTQVNRNSKLSLPTSISEDKYFYLTNNDYSSYTSCIYIRLEDKGFDLDYSKIKYCQTNTNPYSHPESAVNSCSFNTFNNRLSIKYSYSTEYYYIVSNSSYYIYTIISYSGRYSSGSLYVTTNDVNFFDSDSYDDASTVIIISVTIGVFIFLVVFIIILIRCCKRRRSSKVNSNIPVTQPTCAARAPYAYHLDQPAYNYGGKISLQTVHTSMVIKFINLDKYN